MTDQSQTGLVLSLFPGIGLLDRAFEEEGFTIVRGPDLLWGGDIRCFHAPRGVFRGVIGGPPCKPFTSIAAINRHRGRESRHPNLIPEFERVVGEAQPDWWLMENVPRSPDPVVVGYSTQHVVLNNRWLGEEQNRQRRFSFGTADDRRLTFDGDLVLFEHPNFEYAVTGSGGGVGCLRYDRNGTKRPKATNLKAKEASRRPIERLCELQGLPPSFFDDVPFTSDWKKEVLANGVPLPMGRAVARAVKRALSTVDFRRVGAGAG